MSLGEIPGGNLRAYYKLEDVNDSSGNGFTLTNNNSVSFASGKFNNGADFGSSGTNKGLKSTSPLSVIKPTNIFYSFFFKLNSTADTSTRILFHINTTTSGAGGGTFQRVSYSISGGSITYSCAGECPISSAITYTTTADTNFHHFLFVRIPSNTTFVIDNKEIGAVSQDTGWSGFSVSELIIGNGSGLANQAFAIIDEVIISESLYTLSGSDADRIKYRSQLKGFFV